MEKEVQAIHRFATTHNTGGRVWYPLIFPQWTQCLTQLAVEEHLGGREALSSVRKDLGARSLTEHGSCQTSDANDLHTGKYFSYTNSVGRER